MEAIHLQGRLLRDHDDEHGITAILRFDPAEEGGGELVASTHEAFTLREMNIGDDLCPPDPINLIFDATYDILGKQATRRRFFLEECLNLGGGSHWGQVGSAESTKFRPHLIHETNILHDINETPKYDNFWFRLSGTEGWISSLFDIDRNTEWYGDTIKSEGGVITLHPPEVHIMPGLGRLGISSHCYGPVDAFSVEQRVSHLFNVELEHAKSMEEIIRIAGHVADLMFLGTGQPIIYKSITAKLSNLEKSSCTLYFKQRRLTSDTTDPESPMSLIYNSFFRYEDIGGVAGVAKWIARAEMSDIYGWNEKLMTALLMEGEHGDSPSEYTMLPVITAALMLCRQDVGKEGSIASRLKNVLKKAEIPANAQTYLDGDWCDALASLRNKFIAHPESSLGISYPSEGLYARMLLYRVCVSVIVREMLDIDKDKADELVDRIWKHHHTVQYLEMADRNDIKEWYKQHQQTLTEGKLDLFEKRQSAVSEARVPVPLDALPRSLLKKTGEGSSFVVYEYECEHCGTKWRATKHGREKYRLEISGRYNSSQRWDYIVSNRSIKAAQQGVRESVAKHFCVPFKKGNKKKSDM